MWITSFTQNLVPNPGFETYNGCPYPPCSALVFDTLLCAPWESGGGNYFHACSAWPCNVPDNFRGWQSAHGGNGYVGGYQYDNDAGGTSYRELFDVELLDTLVAGECYEVSFYLNLADSSYGCGIMHVGAFFTEEEVPSHSLIGQTPQIGGGPQFYSDSVEWMHVSGHFIAEGGERFMYIGNFHPQDECDVDPGCSDPDGVYYAHAYYYFDDFLVQPASAGAPFTIDLEDSYSGCEYVVLSVEYPDALYVWSDGSTAPTLIVTESGTYSVTVSSHCQTAEATTEVTILGFPPVDIGPDVEMCSGESYTIVLDPMAGEYVWSDGSTGNEYEISTSGIHSVTLDDGCGLTSDAISVTIIDPPPPFSLGEDTVICDGESFQIVLDPLMGMFTWQDGSQAFWIIVNSPGTYAVTVSNECGSATDEIEISEEEAPVLLLEPDSVFLCAGDVFTVELDEDLGNFLWQDGNTNTTYEISAPGTYAVTVTNGCGAASDQMHVIGIDVPVFEFGGPLDLCPGEILILEAPDIYGEYLWEDGSSGELFLVSAPGLYALTITNECGIHSDNMLVEFVPGIELPDLGPDLQLCNGQQVTLSINEIDGDILWSDMSTGNTFVVAEPGTYYVSIFTECGTLSDTIHIAYGNDGPQLNLPEILNICAGDTLLINGDIGNGQYLWSNGSTSSQLEVSSPGLYALTVTNACGFDADTVNVEITALIPTPDLGPDLNLCPGEAGVLYANVDDVSFLWTDVSTGATSDADSLIITNAGVYLLQISDACSSASDTIAITSDANPPDIDLPGPLDLCQGDTLIVDAGITGVQYLWGDGTQLSSIIVNTAGTYSLTVSNACGSDVDSVVINDAGSAPTVSLGNDVEICPGDVALIIPVSNGVESWLWMDSSTSSMLNVQSSGIVSVQGSNQCGSASDTIIVTLLPDVPILDLGSDLSICPGATLTLSITEPDVEILWNDQSTDNQFIVDEAGVVFATISNACGSSSDTVVVELLPDVPALDLGEDQSLCPGETITLDPGIADVNYLWTDALGNVVSISSTTEIATEGIIILTISNACGSSIDTIEIIEDTSGPQLDLGPDILACEGDTVILDAGISGVEYLWNDGSVASQYVATVSGIYSLQVTNACGSDTDTILVDINGTIPTPSLGPDTTLCDDEVLLLISNTDDETDIEWSDGSNGSNLMVSSAGIYILYESNHCGSASDSIIVNYESAPLPFDLGEDVVLCPGESIVLNAPITTDLITWLDASTGSVSTGSTTAVSTSTKIILTISNNCGEVSDEIVISFDAQSPVVELGPSQALCPGQSVTFDVVQAFAAEYLWSTGSTIPTLLISQPDVYAVTVSTECYSVSDDVLIEAEDCGSEIFIPNVFSPNGDNINDEWVVSFSDPSITGIECRIFDRWGDLVFETRDIPIVWNGKQNNQELNPGVFVFMITIKKENGTRSLVSGDITLIR